MITKAEEEKKYQKRKRGTIDAKGRNVRIWDFRTCFQPRPRDSRNPRWPFSPRKEPYSRFLFLYKRKRNWNRLFEIARHPHCPASPRREKCKHGFAEHATDLKTKKKMRMISRRFTKMLKKRILVSQIDNERAKLFRSFSFKSEFFFFNWTIKKINLNIEY